MTHPYLYAQIRYAASQQERDPVTNKRPHDFKKIVAYIKEEYGSDHSEYEDLSPEQAQTFYYMV